MQKILRLFLFCSLGLGVAFAQREIGTVEVIAENKTVPVRVASASPELNALALQAFRAHGRYRVTGSAFSYDIKFTPVAATQVRVDITRSTGTPVHAETVTGSSLRNALLRAADVAVEKTNGLGLRGFFASRIAFISERTGKKEIYTADLFFGEVKQITRDNAHAFGPRWSPDGSKLLYTSYYKSGFPDIFQIDLNTYQRTTFVSFKGTNSGARYSPNGQQVAMVLSGEGNAEIYVSDAQGRQRVAAHAHRRGRGLAVLLARRFAHRFHVRCRGRPAALHHSCRRWHDVARADEHQRLLRGTGLEPGQSQQDRVHHAHRPRLPDRGARFHQGQERAGLAGAVRRRGAELAAGWPASGLYRPRPQHERHFHPRHGNGSQHRGQPEEFRRHPAGERLGALSRDPDRKVRAGPCPQKSRA
jgi:hypothetical protein